MSIDDLSDLPLDAPIGPAPGPHRRPSVVAPAPRWVAPVYLTFAVLLIPWIVYLGFVLPDHTTSRHWDVAWVGFDVALLAALVMTAVNALRRSTWVQASATAASTLLIVDAWFDVTTARRGWDVVQAIVLAAVVELPLAALSLWIARHAEQVNDAATRWLVERSRRQAERLREAKEHLQHHHVARADDAPVTRR